MPRSKTPKPIVGLDIEPTHLAAAEVDVNGSISVRHVAFAPLAPGLVRDGEVSDPAALAEALRAFFRDNDLPKRVRLGVANQRIVVRTLDLPPVTDPKELREAVTFMAADQLPMPLEQAVIDFHNLGLVQTEAGERTRVVLVAARRDMVERLLTAVRDAGLRPEGVDLSAFAMVRALQSHARGVEGAVVYLNVAGMTNLALAQGTICLFTRVVAGGIEGIAAQLAERKGLTLEHARQWMRHVGLVTPIEEIEGEPDIVADTRTILLEGARRIADEARSSLDFFSMQHDAVAVAKGVVTGPAVAIPGFVDELAAGLRIPVEPGVVAESRPGVADISDAGSFTIAAGLAVEEAPA